jgi:SAM-dependent MidA family methyltransferase
MISDHEIVTALAETIAARIEESGPISFHDFMEMALYQPRVGYYETSREKIGAAGDYYTSPSLTPIFGAMVAKQLEEMSKLTGTKPFAIVEFGAGTGCLCESILHHAKQSPRFYNDLTYYIIERSSAMRAKQQSRLQENVQWISDLSAIEPINGCILSNELLDNFPVHRVVMQEELMEIFVGYNGHFFEMLRPATLELKRYFQELDVELPQHFYAEVNLQALDWIKQIASALQKGFVITADYGYTSAELYTPSHRPGTLLCYYQHAVHDDPYQHIGEQDITAHVNFSALIRTGEKYGLTTTGLTTQASFLQGLGLTGYIREMEEKKEPLSSAIDPSSLLQMLLLEMGRKIKVLIQQKGIPFQPLSGLAFGSQKW